MTVRQRIAQRSQSVTPVSLRRCGFRFRMRDDFTERCEVPNTIGARRTFLRVEFRDRFQVPVLKVLEEFPRVRIGQRFTEQIGMATCAFLSFQIEAGGEQTNSFRKFGCTNPVTFLNVSVRRSTWS